MKKYIKVIRKGILVLFITGVTMFSLNAQTGPGGVGATDAPSSLKMWLRADKNVSYNNLKQINEWVDYSGNSFTLVNCATQPVFQSNFINGFPAVNFSSAQAGMSAAAVLGSDLFSAQNNTIIFVKQSESGSNWFTWETATTDTVSFSLSANKSVFNFLNKTSGQLTSSSDVNGAFHIISNVIDGTDQSIFLDGAADGTQANALSLNTALSANLYLGTYDCTATDDWVGYIGEAIIFNTTLNLAERTLVENYLSAKYDLTITNDYYAGDDLVNGDYDFDVAGIGEEADGNSILAVSDGLYIEEETVPLDPGDYLIIGHSSLIDSVTSNDVVASVTHRWNKIWYFDKTGNLDAKVSFDFSEGIDGGTPGEVVNYRLLYRAGTTGNFSEVAVVSTTIENSDQVAFVVADLNLLPGFYTIGTTNAPNSPLEGTKTWYNYYVLDTDDWDDWSRWTLDPDGTLLINPTHVIPGASDTVVILNGSTVNINTDNKVVSKIQILDGGILNIDGATTGHDFTTILGEGRIKLEADNYPAGDDSDFITKGTVEFYGGSYSIANLNTADTFYNLVINLDNAANTIILKDSVVISNDFTVKKGIFQINNTEDDVKYTIDISNDVVVEAFGQIATGTGNPIQTAAYNHYGSMPLIGEFHSIYHEFNVGGNFTNHGPVRFTNLTAPLYNEFTTTGAVTLRFNGLGNHTVDLYSDAYFYNFIVDKGSSQTYILTVYSANLNYFNLYGANRAGRLEGAPFSPENPEIRKALFIQNGTLKLTGNIYIHSLSEGDNTSGNGDYTIGANASLWIAGSGVKLYSTTTSVYVHTHPLPGGTVGFNNASGYQGLSVYGKFRISDGFFGTANSSGIIFWDTANGTMQIEGGTVDISQFRSAVGGSGKANYIQSGGLLMVRGDDKSEAGEVSDANPIFGLVNTSDNFQMSGGAIVIYDDVDGIGVNDFFINCADGNFGVTGGDITIQDNGAKFFDFYSTANLWNLNIKKYVNPGDFTTQLTRDLIVLNDLLIDEDAQLDPTNFDLTIGGDFAIGIETDGTSTAVYVNRDNTTTFNGGGNSIITVSNDAVANYFSPYDLVINKDLSSTTVTMAYRNTTVNPIVNIRNDFTISRGTFDYDSYIIDVKGDLNNNGVMGVWDKTGRIRLDNTGSIQNISSSIGSAYVFGHLEVAHTDGSANNVQLNSNISSDLFTLTSGLVYAHNYKLSVDTNFVGGFADCDVQRMIEFDSSHANRGLKFKMDYNYSVDTTVTFPVGTYDGTTHYWAGADIDITSAVGNVTGSMTVAPVPIAHPTNSSPGCGVLLGYWKVRVDGLSAAASGVSYSFDTNFPDEGSGTYKEWYLMEGSWSQEGNANIPGINTLVDATLDGFKTLDFSCAKNVCFNSVDVIYSNETGGGNWDVGASWQGGSTPGDEDIAVIENGDVISVTRDNIDDVTKVVIRSGGTLDVGIYTGLSYGIVNGGGKFRIASNTGTTPTLPTADFDPFLLNDTAIFEFYGTGSYTLPALTYYPNLKIGGSAGTVKTLPDANITVLQDLMIYDDTNDGVVLRLSNSATSGYDLSVLDSLKLDNQGTLIFPTTGATRTVTVEKSIDMAANGNTDANIIEIEDAAGNLYTDFHNLIVKQDIVLNDNAVITFYIDTTNRRAVDLYFNGSDHSEITSSTSVPALNNLVVDKDLSTSEVLVSSEITFTEDTYRPITFNRGHLIFDNSDINISLSSEDGDFTIPENSKLSLRNGSIANITGASTGIILNGSLFLEGSSQLLLNDGTYDNFIEYSSSGNSIINVSGTSVLNVGSQLRRKTTSDQGVLKYYQSGGTVTLGNNSAPITSRGVFEVMNTNSVFDYTGGNLIIARSQSVSNPAVYLDPTSSTLVDGATLTFGNDNTPTGQNIGIYSAIALKDIVVSNLGEAKTVTVYTLGLTIDSLNINTGQTFDANDLDLTLNGNFRNDGTYTPGTNTTSFTSADQKVIGATTFNNLSANLTTSSDSLEIYNDITVNENLTITNGRLHDRSNTITLLGDFSNSGVHYSQSTTTGGVLFNGSLRQEIAGTGTYGLLEINNTAGVELLNDFILVDRNIILTSGSFFIKQFQLQLGLNADVTVPSGDFSKNRMVVSNGASSDDGIKKWVNAGTPADILIPIGVVGSYTPIYISNITTVGPGSVFVRPVNSDHPTALDPTNVLQYYWNMQTVGFTSFMADVDFYYEQADVAVTGINLESDYIPAYLLDVNWSKFGAESVDANLNIVKFNFSTGEQLNGDFTAGISDAIPDQVPVFVSKEIGNWENINTWEREDAEPVTSYPNGHVVRIKHDVTIASNLKSAYKTIIDTTGKLIVGNTIGHYFGRVSGRGHLALTTGRLPAGNYDDFFDCSGGTIEWGGDVNYELPDEGTNFRRMLFTGTGTKTLSSNNITICDTLWINGPILNNDTHDNTITINGFFHLESGEFHSGTTLSTAALIFSGTSAQTITGDFTDNTDNNTLNNVTMNNATGLTLDGDVTLKGDLTLTSGNIDPNGNAFTLEIASDVSPVGGSAASFVDGPMFKDLASFSNFEFPIGDGTRYGKLEIFNTTTGIVTWEAQYYNYNPTAHVPSLDITSMEDPPIKFVSDNEFWRLDGLTSAAEAMIRWDDQSVLPAQVSDFDDLAIARWSTSSRWEEVVGTVADGGVNSGTITSDAALATGEHFLTLGSKDATPLGTATITSGDVSICDGGSTNISIDLTGTATWKLEIYKDGGWYSDETLIGASPYLLNVTTAGLYTINDVWDANDLVLGTVFGSGVTVTVVPVPDNLLTVTGGGPYCAGGTGVVVGLSGSELSVNYELFVDGSPLNTVAGTGAAISFGLQTTAGDYTVEGTHSTDAADLCTQTMTGSQTITIIPAPTATITVNVALDSICDGINTQIDIDFTAGATPWDLVIDDGTNPVENIDDVLDPYTYNPSVFPIWVDDGSPDTDYVYSIQITDDNGCTNSYNSSTVTVFKIPDTGDQYHISNDWAN
ncbi:MAG: hypothetical protein PF485_15095 [Bacteroidales bacterium]|jgi:hypothetical protein|nr:hypothetical protein [Bacteroidales bacterium]